MSERVSAVICTRDRPLLIGQAVVSVLENTYPSFDLVIVDQSDDDQTGEVIRALMIEHPNLRYIHSTTPGLSRARNRGVRESSAAIVAFTDDDCVVAPDWVASIVASFEANPAADMLYGQVLRAPTLVDVEGEVPELPFDRTELLSLSEGFRLYGMGANFAVKRSLFERVGGFDEMIGAGGPLKSAEDFDFQYRVYRMGATVLLSPVVKVDHYGLRNYGVQWPATLRAYGFGDGAFYFKHVRCGDMFALSLLLQKLTLMSVREVLSQLGLRRRPSRLDYVQAFVDGIWQSLRYQVDRDARLYRAAARA